jgi:ABC-2 type transport system permease protein
MKYFKFSLRRDAFAIIVWVLSIFAMNASGAQKLSIVSGGTKAGAQMLQQFEGLLQLPSMIAMLGRTDVPKAQLNGTTIFAASMTLFVAVLIACMNIYLVNRSMRASEDDGVFEMLLSLPLAKKSIFITLQIELFIANLLVFLSTIVVVIAMMPKTSVADAGAYAITTTLVGYFFSSITLIINQIVSEKSQASSLAYGFLALAYGVRAATDISAPKWSVISPLGWGSAVNPTVQNHYAYLILPVVFGVVFTLIAYVIYRRRDVGSGLLNVGGGSKHAAPYFRNPVGLFIRLNAKTFALQAVIMVAFSAMYGSIIGMFSTMKMNSELRQLIQGSGTDIETGYFAMIASVIAAFICIFAISYIGQLSNFEGDGPSELFYSLKVSRIKLLVTYIIYDIIIGIVLFAISGAVMAALTTKNFAFDEAFIGIIKYFPVYLVFLSLAVFVIGVAPRLKVVLYPLLGLSALLNFFKNLFDIPAWLRHLIIFDDIKATPLKEIDWYTNGVFVGMAIIFLVAGVTAYRNRDLN